MDKGTKMGKPGPIPKRSSERRRRNKPDIPIISEPPRTAPSASSVGHGSLPDLEWPDPDPEWHPGITRWYLSLRRSPMLRFYVETDVAEAWIRAEIGNRMVNGAGTRAIGKGVSGQLYAAWTDSTADLGTTEGARRRLRIELERPDDSEVPHSVIQLNKYRRRLASGDTAGSDA